MVQLGFYYHMKEAIGAAHPQMTPPLIFAISFMVLCSVVIALFKDVPDLQGDEQVRSRLLSWCSHQHKQSRMSVLSHASFACSLGVSSFGCLYLANQGVATALAAKLNGTCVSAALCYSQLACCVDY